MLEFGFYEQIHVREFAAPGWNLQFNSPDFLSALERATVDMRYFQLNAKTVNEVRRSVGLAERSDGRGDWFADQFNEYGNSSIGDENDGIIDPPEIEAQDEDAVQEHPDDPVRGDDHDDFGSGNRKWLDDVVDELEIFRKFSKKRLKAGKQLRQFNSSILSGDLVATIQEHVKGVSSPAGVDAVIDSVVRDIRESYDER
jgi:hypothetical protein